MLGAFGQQAFVYLRKRTGWSNHIGECVHKVSCIYGHTSLSCRLASLASPHLAPPLVNDSTLRMTECGTRAACASVWHVSSKPRATSRHVAAVGDRIPSVPTVPNCLMLTGLVWPWISRTDSRFQSHTSSYADFKIGQCRAAGGTLIMRKTSPLSRRRRSHFPDVRNSLRYHEQSSIL
ncbi:hypothetical protein BD311DRAFT_279447 [Dichomitus squalens]|uniref:Uncharacterized protein n=1 Tax=Dichomitus squalens TaxID=114155 RepID=A0A4Q9N3A7_9APHY|nr:hypothetical protein BD311DRAFT_279447 [Dichomitus squalens]